VLHSFYLLIFFIQLTSCNSKTLDILYLINFIFQDLEGRRDPLSTGALLAGKYHLSEFDLALGTVKLNLVVHVISVQPGWLLNENGCTFLIGMND
jgi:hypothetical protein